MVDKPKSGFQIPLNEWLRDELRTMVDKYICSEKLDDNIFDINQVLSIKDKFYKGENLGTQIWLILIYQMWKEKWLD